MAGTIVVDRIESDASYASTINVAGQITFSNTVNFGVFAGTAPVAGFYLPTTNALAFTTASTERMRIDSSGNVGIGTASPSVKLDVIGSGKFTGITEFTNAVNLTTSTLNYVYFNDAIAFARNGTGERMRIDSSGNVGIGTASPSSFGKVAVEVPGTTTPTSLTTVGPSSVNLYAATNGGSTNSTMGVFGWNSTSGIGSGIGFSRENTADWGTQLRFYTHPTTTSNIGDITERMRIKSDGYLLVATTSTDVADANASGYSFSPDGNLQISRASNAAFNVNRKTNDGILVYFHQDGTVEGTISVSGTTVSYNGGHLSRWAQTTAPKDNTLVKGTVLSNLDEMNVYTKNGQPVDNEQLNKVKMSDVEGDINVAGVFVNWDHDEAHNVDEINMAMTGDMIIRIAQGTTVARGDLLMSAGDGTAKPQGDDIVRSKTVAKVTSTHVTCTYADGSYCVPCVLMAC